MSFRVVTRAMLATEVVNNWRHQYNIDTSQWRKMWEPLIARGESLKPDDVDAVTGGKTLTRLWCAACHEWTNGPWVLFGEACEHYTICATCIGLAAGALREVTE